MGALTTPPQVIILRLPPTPPLTTLVQLRLNTPLRSMSSLNPSAPATFVACLVSMGFFGVIVTQFILYIRRYPKDRMFLKLLVYGVTLLQAAQQVLFTVNAWGVVINPGVSGQVLQRVTASNILIDAVIVAISQAFYASRIWTCDVYYAGRGMRKIHASISSSKLLLIIGTEVHFGTGQHGAVFLVYKILSVVSSDDDTMIKGILISVNAVTWSTGLLLSAIFVYSLLKSRTGSSFRVGWILFVVNAGTFTVVWGIAAFVLLLRGPYTVVPGLLYVTGSNSYTMSLICSLLSRFKPEDWENEGPIEVELPDINPGTFVLSTVEAQATSFQTHTAEEQSVKASSEDGARGSG
ncbi:hypothetical protein GSI_09329 [Ganoderma sinense ZZ0214-1]|uniref:Uncharacterized protein n=1 Tax=Ganoderma sinense ZZ0214-1 TaxID=1077348 RepID=A0A2G8S666_9APHY|nr:hypothetical protein GSI_09329 [Ganoderma sinense ZZ0214-1]